MVNLARINYWKLLVSIAIPLIVGFTSSLPTMDAIPTWYQTLAKPILAPPNWLFAPAWTTLYVLMGISLYLIWMKGTRSRAVMKGISLYSIQLILNFFWSILFFGLKSPFLASLEIIVLWIFILLTIIQFYKISKPAAYLLIPYILWVTFASYLSFSVFLLNM